MYAILSDRGRQYKVREGEVLRVDALTAEKGAANKIGPNLFGVVGRKSATAPAYMYSPAMMMANLTWDVPTLQVYLMGPQKKVPGTKMGFPGFSDPQDEADAIAYLVTLK